MSGLAEDSDDAQSIIQFWNAHFPFMQSVRIGYAYLAFDKDGQAVYGFEPGFEEPYTICASFQEFMAVMTTAIVDKHNVFGIRDFAGLPGEEQR